MLKELDLPRSEFAQLAERLANVFVQRRDLYARQMQDGSYVCIRKPLQPWHLAAHLRGELTLGTYVLSAEAQTRFIAFDADGEEDFQRLTLMASSLADEGIPAYLEQSRRGGHLWFFFESQVAGRDARAFGLGLMAAFNLKEIELFPKQSHLKDGPGSLIRLPFGVHRKTGQRYGFVTPDGLPIAPTLAEQIELLCTPQAVLAGHYLRYASFTSKTEKKPDFRTSSAAEGSLSKRIKDSVTVLEFVSHYVELSASGRGQCPFHSDDHASFAVNDKGNYWNCFAGCGGGSIIDFWMKWKGCDFTTAVRELARMLL